MSMFEHETRTLIANERVDQLRAAGLAPASSLRLTLGEWLISAGRHVLPECPDCERSALAHKALASLRS